MYQELYNYGQKYQIVAPPNRIKRTIHGYIELSQNGDFISLAEVPKDDNTIRPLFPDRRGGNYDASILAAKAGEIFTNIYLNQKKDVIKENDKTKYQKKHESFCQITQQGAEAGIESLVTIAGFLKQCDEDAQLQEVIKTQLTTHKIKPENYLGFRIDTLNTEKMTDWCKWWDETVCGSSAKVERKKIISSITGSLVDAYPEKFTKVMAKQAGSGAPIYSNEHGSCQGTKCSFSSYGSADNASSGISFEEANVINSVIEFFLEDKHHHNNDMGIIWWYDDKTSPDIISDQLEWDNEFSSFITDEIEMVKQHSPWDKENHFHMMQFDFPAKGRMIFSNYQAIPYKTLVTNLRKWTEDCSINYGVFDSNTSTLENRTILSLQPNTVLNQTVTHSDKSKKKDWKDKIKEHKGSMPQFINTVFFGAQMPINIVRKAQHQLVRIHTTPSIKQDEKRNEGVLLQILKIYLNRTGKEKNHMSVGLDKELDNAGYLCGMYFAFICRLQYEGIKKNTIEQQYYNLASQYPQKAFTILNRKVEGAYLRRTKAPNYWKAQRDEILRKFKDTIPAKLTMEEQAAFMIGFSHQNAEFFKKKEDAGSNTDKENNTLNEKENTNE